MIKIRPVPEAVNHQSFNYLMVTWLYSGRIRPMSGTWGSLAALPFCWAISVTLGQMGLIVFGLALFIVGLKALKDYLPRAGNTDPSEVVIDEVIGMAIMWLFLPSNNFWPIVLGFIVFRLFDSVKAGPVGWCDQNIKGPLGVIMDDVVAGLLAGILILIGHLALRSL